MGFYNLILWVAVHSGAFGELICREYIGVIQGIWNPKARISTIQFECLLTICQWPLPVVCQCTKRCKQFFSWERCFTAAASLGPRLSLGLYFKARNAPHVELHPSIPPLLGFLELAKQTKLP